MNWPHQLYSPSVFAYDAFVPDHTVHTVIHLLHADKFRDTNDLEHLNEWTNTFLLNVFKIIRLSNNQTNYCTPLFTNSIIIRSLVDSTQAVLLLVAIHLFNPHCHGTWRSYTDVVSRTISCDRLGLQESIPHGFDYINPSLYIYDITKVHLFQFFDSPFIILLG